MVALLSIALLCAPPEGPPQLGAHSFEVLGATVELPQSWTVLDEELEQARVRIDELGGMVQISRGTAGKSIKAIRRAVLRAARKAGWRTVQRRWTRLAGEKAAALLFDIDKGGVVSRQLFYLSEIGGELWVLQFGTRRDVFDYDAYRAIAASLKPL